MLDIVVLVSGHGSNLQAIIDSIDAQDNPKAQIKAIISNKRNAYSLERARKHAIPAYVISKKNNQSREDYDQRLAEVLQNLDPDLIVLAGFMRIFTEGLVNQFKGKIINIHPSLLPKYKGLSTHQRALDAGDSEHGCSVHFVTPELDGGPVIAQSKLSIESDDNISKLSARVQTLEHKLYPLIIDWIASKRLEYSDSKILLDGTELAEPFQMNSK